MITTVYDTQKDLSIDQDSVRQLVRSLLLDFLKIEVDEMIVNFVTPYKIKKLHKDFFNDPSLTDCISFPLDDQDSNNPYTLLGEIFVCPYTAIDYSKKNQADPYLETSLYIVHGILHLIGYDDIEEKERIKMRKMEKKSLDFLIQHNLLVKKGL